MSMKFTPTYSFFIRTSPSFGSGIGRSVLNCKTSVPPVFSIMIPSIAFGRVDILRDGAARWGFPSWEVRAVRRRVVERRAR